MNLNVKIVVIFTAVIFSSAGILIAIDQTDVKPVSDSSPYQDIIYANNQFGLDFYSQINGNNDNLFFSPWSISTAFAILQEGARGNTAKQIGDAFGFSDDSSQRQSGFKSFNDRLNHPNSDYLLSVANAFWLSHDFAPKQNYVDVTKDYYDSHVEQVDFSADGTDIINKWVSSKTHGKIKDLFEPGALDGASFAITNAIYFKGTWNKQFDPDRTKMRDFWASEDSAISVPMMYLPESKQRAALTEEVHLLELPYDGDKISMLVLLPAQRHGLSGLESALSIEKISQWKKDLQESSMAVMMPKFKLETDYDLIPLLKSLGVSDAFGADADFGGISDSNLFVGEAVHKAFVEINEEGTEAAAATGIGGFQSGPPTFEVDQPFMFVIQDNESGNILFMGRVIDPT